MCNFKVTLRNVGSSSLARCQSVASSATIDAQISRPLDTICVVSCSRRYSHLAAFGPSAGHWAPSIEILVTALRR